MERNKAFLLGAIAIFLFVSLPVLAQDGGDQVPAAPKCELGSLSVEHDGHVHCANNCQNPSYPFCHTIWGTGFFGGKYTVCLCKDARQGGGDSEPVETLASLTSGEKPACQISRVNRKELRAMKKEYAAELLEAENTTE